MLCLLITTLYVYHHYSMTVYNVKEKSCKPNILLWNLYYSKLQASYLPMNMNIRYDNKMILRKESDMFFYVEIDVVRMWQTNYRSAIIYNYYTTQITLKVTLIHHIIEFHTMKLYFDWIIYHFWRINLVESQSCCETTDYIS